jgi:hypothetical protein
MAGERSRQEARERVMATVKKLLDKHIPEDEKLPVKDGKFWEWEDMADEFDREVTGAFVESLAELSGQAKLDHPGACPYCGCMRVRWLEKSKQQERQSKHGVVVLPRQVARCRSCGRSFSPSGAGLGLGRANAPDAAGAGEGLPGGGADAL